MENQQMPREDENLFLRNAENDFSSGPLAASSDDEDESEDEDADELAEDSELDDEV